MLRLLRYNGCSGVVVFHYMGTKVVKDPVDAFVDVLGRMLIEVKIPRNRGGGLVIPRHFTQYQFVKGPVGLMLKQQCVAHMQKFQPRREAQVRYDTS